MPVIEATQLEVIIGLEVHAQMNTKSKMFCRCDNDAFGKDPNTLVCPICMGFPGMLPALNVEVVNKGVQTALALQCDILPLSKFDRKSYFYPDLPKGYQISQFHKPLSVAGKLDIDLSNGDTKTIRINRLHIEDDAGKLIHEGGFSFCDYNRSGTPLMEIVTEPDMRSPEEAKAFAEILQKLLQYIGSSDADMYKGMMRFDASVSMRPKGEDKLYPRTEVKNLNSFRALESAINYEIRRQTQLWKEGTHQDHDITVGWLDDLGKTHFLRDKEGADDYRYFPEPDLPPLTFTNDYVEQTREGLPELYPAKKKRFEEQYNLSENDLETLTASKDLADYFEKAVQDSGDQKRAQSFILTFLLKFLKEDEKKISECSITVDKLVELIKIINSGEISGNTGKEVIEEMYETGKNASTIIQEKGLKQVSDEGELEGICQNIVNENSKIVEDFKNGKDRAFGALVGKVMAQTKGQANPTIVNDILKKLI